MVYAAALDNIFCAFRVRLSGIYNYRLALSVREPEQTLYVGITDDVYEEVFQLPFAQMVITELKMKLVVVNLEKTEVVKLIK